MIAEDPHPQEVAFYYPGHLWNEPEWIKSLLLFFDGIGLLVPEYKQHEPELVDPVLAGPLRDRKLLHYLVADQVVDQDTTKHLATEMGKLMDAGVFDRIDRRGTAFEAISMSRMGFYGDEKLAGELLEELEKRDLARRSEDGVSVPLHPLVRYLILTLLAQILRSKASTEDLEFSPATDRTEVVNALSELLDKPQLASAGHVVSFDLQTVSVDLSSVPLDEVLAFRTENLKDYRRYVRSVRSFARDLSLLSPIDRRGAFRDRKGELDDLASDLSGRARSAWRRPVSFGLGLAGAFWTAVTNPVGAALSLGGLLTRGNEGSSREVGAFTYLFAARKEFFFNRRSKLKLG
jgi:hypothetical protein